MRKKNKFMAATLAASVFVSACGSTASGKGTDSIIDSLKITPKPNADGNYNIILIISDQERYLEKYPDGSNYEARKLLAELGTTFEKHYTCSAMSTSSRSVIYTGTHITKTKMIDNTDFDWQGPLSTDITTIGDMMRSADYYTAYKGKWHMANSSTLSTTDDELTDLEEYGFADWNVSHDYIGKMWEGYELDPEIVGDTIEWLQNVGTAKNRSGQSFFLPINLINPHDIAYFNTDPNFKGPVPVGGAPDDEVYKKSYDVDVPSSWNQNVNNGTLPDAIAIYKKFIEKQLGSITTEASWKDAQDYYFNCIKDSDNKLMDILQTLIKNDMMNNTIIIFTSDHGEMGGAHNLKGKGGFVYEENTHVPLIIYHPDYKGSRSVKEITSHLDLAKTIVNMTNIGIDKKEEITEGLTGINLMEIIKDPTKSVREGALFCAELISTTMAQSYSDQYGNTRYVFNLETRGLVRGIITKKYKFARYFSANFNTPTTIAEIFKNNDVELYDLENDPKELNNLANNPQENASVIMDLNAKLNQLIAREIGVDDGSEFTSTLAAYMAGQDLAKQNGGCSTEVSSVTSIFLLLPLLTLLSNVRRRK